MITIKQLWEAMPDDVQHKISCYDLDRICRALNKDDPEYRKIRPKEKSELTVIMIEEISKLKADEIR